MTKLFDNTAVAFKIKTDSELERAYFLFKMIQNEPLVRIGTAVTNFALNTRLPVEKLIRSTVFDHFCGGVTTVDCLPAIKKMYSEHVHSILDFSVEGKESEAEFDKALEKTLKTVEFAKEKDSIPFAVFKPSGFGRFSLYQKVSDKLSLSSLEKLEWNRVVERYHSICKKALELNIPLLIDAEESWIQGAVDGLIEELMTIYNKETAIVFSTLQMYRWDRMDYLKKLHAKSKAENFYIGLKIVRGAYMEKERDRAEKHGYKSPICMNKKETDLNYNTAINYMVKHDKMSVFAGTHNEDSSYLLMELLEKLGLEKNDSRVWFGQLYGMSDHISFNLSAQNYNIAKYLPYGPVRDVMPYLIRRAEENTSVAGQTSRELNLLKTERKRRKL